MSELVLNWFSSIQFLETTYVKHVGLYWGAAFVSDVINKIALSAQFFGRNTPAIYFRIFYSRIFSAPSCSTTLATVHSVIFCTNISWAAFAHASHNVSHVCCFDVGDASQFRQLTIDLTVHSIQLR